MGIFIYLEIAIACFLSLRHSMSLSNTLYVVSSIVSVLVLICIILFSVYIPVLAWRNFERVSKFDKFELTRPYWTVIGHLKQNSRCAILYYFWFIVRRIFYAAIIVFLIKFPLVQAILIILIFFPIFAYTLIFRPF